ncbi:MAG: hypothetical protein P1U57_08915, partial [Oleibacter sp.]|nr:hypothetical protein [Thalassolituus sp.]
MFAIPSDKNGKITETVPFIADMKSVQFGFDVLCIKQSMLGNGSLELIFASISETILAPVKRDKLSILSVIATSSESNTSNGRIRNVLM